ncbi:MAG TPA: hypothetical protein VLT87_27525 [Thermoanaerobaculia bacterium]|nr:hypothetical protein [Thermoanaerobaculia bacterium]
MPVPHSLTLFRPGEEPDRPLSKLPPEVPRTFTGAGLLLNHGILAAELLGLDTREAQTAIDVAGGMPEGVLRAYDEEDAEILAKILAATAAALGEALDAGGGSRGPLGERLAASPLLGLDDQGRLFFKSRHLLVNDLRRELPALSRFLKFAADHGLWLRIE